MVLIARFLTGRCAMPSINLAKSFIVLSPSLHNYVPVEERHRLIGYRYRLIPGKRSTTARSREKLKNQAFREAASCRNPP